MKKALLICLINLFFIDVFSQSFSRKVIQAIHKMEKGDGDAARSLISKVPPIKVVRNEPLYSFVLGEIYEKERQFSAAEQKYISAKAGYARLIKSKPRYENYLRKKFGIEVMQLDRCIANMEEKKMKLKLPIPFDVREGDTMQAQTLLDNKVQLMKYQDSAAVSKAEVEIMHKYRKQGILPNHFSFSEKRTGPHNQDVEINVEYGDSAAKMDMSSFNRGVYATEMTQRVLVILQQMLEDFFKAKKEVSLGKITMDITGYADGYPVDPNNTSLRYAEPIDPKLKEVEDFGIIQNEKYKKLGTTTSDTINLQKGDLIRSNYMLAFLRAYQVKYALSEIPEMRLGTTNIFSSAEKDTGGINRKVAIKIYMKDVFKADFQRLAPFCQTFVDNSRVKGKPDLIDLEPQKTPDSLKRNYARQTAVLIGISEYKNLNHKRPDMNGLEDLYYGEKDANDFSDFLMSDAYTGGNWDIHSFTGKRATAENVKRGLKEVLLKADTDDLIYVFFSGHGIDDPDDQNDAHLLLYDYSPKVVTNNLSLNGELLNWIRICPAKHVVLFLDACKSGSIAFDRKLKGSPKKLSISEKVTSEPSHKIIFTSTTGSDNSLEGQGDTQNGLFTYYLLKGLKGACSDDFPNGYVDVKELYSYLLANVTSTSNTEKYQYKKQIPWLCDLNNMDYKFYPLAVRIK